MTARPDLDRTIANWIDRDDSIDLSPESLDRALAMARTLPQRRGLRALLFGSPPWPTPHGPRFTALSPAVRVAIAALLLTGLLVSAALVGSRLLQRDALPAFEPPPAGRTAYQGSFRPLGVAPEDLNLHTVVGLPDGRLLVIAADDDRRVVAWNPGTGVVADVGRLHHRRIQAQTVPLPDGRILVFEGDQTPPVDGVSSPAPSTGELFDPATGTFRDLGPLVGEGYIRSTTLLQDGRVLLAGGTPLDGTGVALQAAELFDPATGRFTATGDLATPRLGASVVTLTDGRALVIGGTDGSQPSTWLTTAEIYDPATGRFAPTGAMRPLPEDPDATQYSLQARASAVLLPDGRVLVPGLHCQEVHDFRADGRSDGFQPTPTEIYDPASGTFSAGVAMPHCVEKAFALPSDEVFVSGWWYEDVPPDDTGLQSSVRPWSALYDPQTGLVREIEAAPGERYMLLIERAGGELAVMGPDRTLLALE